ncbi:MAG: hypothetical protein JNM27_16370 [Leptospirales bacterium]|nr:hypothetical protein [Leptospirales bacterium]
MLRSLLFFCILAFVNCALLLPEKTQTDQTMVLALLAASAGPRNTSSASTCMITWNGSTGAKVPKIPSGSTEAVFTEFRDHFAQYLQFNSVPAGQTWTVTNYNYVPADGAGSFGATVAGCPANLDSAPAASVTMPSIGGGNNANPGTNRTLTFTAAGSFLVGFYTGSQGANISNVTITRN